MTQPPWIPPTGGAPGDAEDEPRHRGTHSGEDTPPPADDLWGGPGTPGPWSGGSDSPWTSSPATDPWAGAAGSWSAAPERPPAADDAGPAYPVPGARPPAGSPPAEPAREDTGPAAPQPWASGRPDASPTHAGAGYGPPSYADPSQPSAGPAVGEPGYGPAGPGGYGPPDPRNQQDPRSQPDLRQQQPDPRHQPDPRQQPGAGEPFRSVRSDAVPPAGSERPAPDTGYQPRRSHPDSAEPTPASAGGGEPGPAAPPRDRDLAHPAEAAPGPVGGGYTPADPPPTPRPPQPELPDSMSDVPQYAARLAPAPLPDDPTAAAAPGGAPPATGGWGTPTPDPGPTGAPAGWPVGGPPAGGPVHAAGGTPPPPAMPRPEDLLQSSRPRTLEKPATWGWRGRFARWSGGMYKPKPSQAELADRQAKLNAQRGFSRPMTVVVIQPKGGAGKTPTTICVSSALGVRRGGYIVGWDNNETRGTLAVRTTNDDNQRTTAWDLLGRLDEFERSEARVGDLAYYMRAQGDAQFDALVSDDNPGNMAQIGEVEFRRIHQVLQRFYRMIIIDTGNNVRSTNWQAAVDHADQIVVVTTYQRDVGYSGSWVLDHLAQTGRDELARDAITVLTAAEPTVDQQVQGELVKHFGARTRAVVEVPYDPHIAEGGPIRWAELSEGSKRAWTSVAAAITQTLYDRDQRQLATRGRPGA